MRNTLCGYMTLEAALLMPIVWFSLFFIIYMGFYQYDRCIAEQDSKIIVLRASDMRGKDEAAVIRTVLEESELAGKKKLIFSKGIQRELHITSNKAKIKISGGVNTILSSLVKEERLNIFSYAAEYEAEKYDPVQVIRTCRRIESYERN